MAAIDRVGPPPTKGKTLLDLLRGAYSDGGRRQGSPWGTGSDAAPPAQQPINAGRPRSRFSSNRDTYFQNARAGLQMGPPPSGNRQPDGTKFWDDTPAPPPDTAPAAGRGNGGGGGGGGGAAAVMAKAAPAGTPIAPGARDLLDAGAQLEALGLGRLRAGGGAAGGISFADAYKASPEGMAKLGESFASTSSLDPAAFKDMPPIDPASFSAEAPKLDLGYNPEQLAFNPGNAAFSGASSEADLNARRRAAFLDPNVDSLEGMRRARLVMADEIAARGGDLQKFAADSGQMRPMSMKQLEGYANQLQSGAAPAAAVDTGTPAIRRGMDPLQDEWEATQDEELGYMNDVEAGLEEASSAPTAAVDAVLRNRSQQAYRAAGNGTLAYQTGSQASPGISGEPNQAALASLAAQGVDAASITPPEMTAMYGSTNALALGLGGPTRGATTKLPMLTPEEVAQRLQQVRGGSFVTPPAGFDFYNRA